MGAFKGIFGILLAVLIASIHQIYVKPALKIWGIKGRDNLPTIGTGDCTTKPALEACEDMKLASDGTLYLACSSIPNRALWIPALNNLNGTGSGSDWFATYNPSTGDVTRLMVDGYNHKSGLSLHGMDVVEKPFSKQFFVFAINHRAENRTGINDKGANSVVEIFTTKIGGKTLLHLYTVEDPLIATPNSVVGFEDGKSFFITNDHHLRKTGWRRQQRLLGVKESSVVYCNVDRGCSLAYKHLLNGANGLAYSRSNHTVYVGNSAYGGISVFEERKEGKLGFREVIPTDFPIDNLILDSNGALWAAGFPKILQAKAYLRSPSTAKVPPSATLRIAQNTGPGSFYGEKYKQDIVFQDKTTLAAGTTTSVYDVERKKLYMTGVVTPHLTICNV